MTTTAPQQGAALPAAPRRTRPARASRARISAYYSKNSEYRTYHLDLSCRGAERMKVHPPEQATLVHETFKDLFELGRDERGRPCRLCAQEIVLDTVLRPRRGSELVFTSFSSQGNPHEKIETFRWSGTTERGEATLERIARRLDLPTVRTGIGPVAYGFLPLEGARILAANLRTVVRAEYDAPPRGDVVALAWTLMGDEPPELRAHALAQEERLRELLVQMQASGYAPPSASSIPSVLGASTIGYEGLRMDPLALAACTSDPWELAGLTLA